MAEHLHRLSDPRVTVRRPGDPDPNGRAVVYWMQRAQRGTDNPALDVAIEAANALGLPVVVFLGLTPTYPNANLRHYRFMAEGFADIAEALRARRLGFIIRRSPDHDLGRFCHEAGAALVVGDENPLREPERWRADYAARLRVPFWTVDADVVVPTALLGKEQYAARTMRPRIRPLITRFLEATHEPRARVAWTAPPSLRSEQPDAAAIDGLAVDASVAPVPGLHGGPRQAMKGLQRFLRQRLTGYATNRNHPELEATSQLSPYLHFGHIGPRSVARAVRDADAPREDRDAFLEEFIVRRELATNFVRFNPRYDSLDGCEPWALRTLAAHAADARHPRYTAGQLEHAETHDPLWNAAQIQMVETGWMHGYVRMYWAKKILEWTRAPGQAFATAVELNDRYELDGRDPNGYTGIAWAIGGKHDRAWGPEREVYGTVRYMSFASTSRKFDSKRYIRRITEETGRHVTGA
ncbi:MAG: deoxyribodipyrimidine photo-lyase [Acidobacteria bacterium]|nr:deoxyribodipyrimidine photo-lyase [Acidobacteriota bacterium]